VEETRDMAKRMTAQSVGDLARGVGLGTGGSPGGGTTVVRNAERVRRGESLVESTHRHDRVMVEVERKARGVKRSREVAEKRGGDKKFYEEVAVRIAESFCSLDDLDEDERRKVVDLQKMAATGKKKEDENMQRVEMRGVMRWMLMERRERVVRKRVLVEGGRRRRNTETLLEKWHERGLLQEGGGEVVRATQEDLEDGREMVKEI
jgi:hypothetical protein